MPAIELVETRQGCQLLESHPRYIVMFRGKPYGELYFNMRGYTGCYLPAPGSTQGKVACRDIGERGIGAVRKEVAKLNREWAAASTTGVSQP
jgi:hypothetical protein